MGTGGAREARPTAMRLPLELEQVEDRSREAQFLENPKGDRVIQTVKGLLEIQSHRIRKLLGIKLDVKRAEQSWLGFAQGKRQGERQSLANGDGPRAGRWRCQQRRAEHRLPRGSRFCGLLARRRLSSNTWLLKSVVCFAKEEERAQSVQALIKEKAEDLGRKPILSTRVDHLLDSLSDVDGLKGRAGPAENSHIYPRNPADQRRTHLVDRAQKSSAGADALQHKPAA